MSGSTFVQEELLYLGGIELETDSSSADGSRPCRAALRTSYNCLKAFRQSLNRLKSSLEEGCQPTGKCCPQRRVSQAVKNVLMDGNEINN